MVEIDPLPFVSELGAPGDFLRKIDLRLERENQRMLANLMAWAGILDALGWNVALLLPGREPVMSPKAREWAAKQVEVPFSQEAVSACLSESPPARYLVCSCHVRVWADAEPESDGDVKQSAPVPLTKREREVLGWLREGKTGPEIAIILGCACRTVESHVARLYRKLGVHQRTHLLFQTDMNSR
ncbi:MAG: helix-turn-helix transcriptional regulator [Verrucomicrobiota bacterium]